MPSDRMSFKAMLSVSGFVLAALWLVLGAGYLLGTFFHYDINQYGIRPREWRGLAGIPLAPFLHAGVGHLLANMSALLLLGLALMLLEGRKALGIVATIVLLGGLGTWLIGRGGSVHIGASGLVFGLLGYLLASGWYRRKFSYFITALLVLFFYGGALLGVLPSSPAVSWEGHLCGFLVGVADAKWRAEERQF